MKWSGMPGYMRYYKRLLLGLAIGGLYDKFCYATWAWPMNWHLVAALVLLCVNSYVYAMNIRSLLV